MIYPRKSCILITIVAINLLSFAAFPQNKIKDIEPTIILISLDGFRYDYVDKYEAPNIRKLAVEGVRAKWMIPSFPTKTFPNHYTVVTGLYPANHGLVENMYLTLAPFLRCRNAKRSKIPVGGAANRSG